MNMHFEGSSSVKLLFDFWDVHGPAGTCWLLHCLQTAIHLLQVTLGYMLMLCVMSYNVWIFLGVIIGSVLGYFLAFPLLNHI